MNILLRIILILLGIALFIGSIFYWVCFEADKYYKKIKTKQDMILTAVTFYWWYKMAKDKYDTLEEN